MNFYLCIGIVVGAWACSIQSEKESMRRLLRGTGDDPGLDALVMLMVLVMCMFFWPVVVLGYRNED